MLCRYAQEENESLHIIGGGWNRLRPRELPHREAFYLAIRLLVDKENAPPSFSLRIDMTDADGLPLGEPTTSVFEAESQHTGERTVSMDSPINLAMHGVFEIQQAGVYTISLSANGLQAAKTEFVVDEPTYQKDDEDRADEEGDHSDE